MRKILIVDDDVTSVAIVKALLSDEFDVVTANSGLEALGHLQKDPDLSLILLDMIMPGASGMDVLKALKGSDSWSEIPVIFLTSMEKMRVELEGLCQRCGGFHPEAGERRSAPAEDQAAAVHPGPEDGKSAFAEDTAADQVPSGSDF